MTIQTVPKTMLYFIRKNLWLCLSVAAFSLLLTACAEDYQPVYFPPADEAPTGPAPDESAEGRQCTISFTSQLCIVIQGDDIEAGTNPEEPLCEEIPPFPIHITGNEVKLIGSEFPDVKVEGHGLPAPITINAKGSGSGDSNVGIGTIDAQGSITIENFSFFIDALGMIGEIPNLTLTTGFTEELPHLPAIEGRAPDATGAMTLVTGTIIGHTFDAADEILMGASLTATFQGSISPVLDECGGESGPASIEIRKLFVNGDGEYSEEDLPDGNKMEISSGTFIAQGANDVGPRFEATASFKVKNISSKTIAIQIPSKIGPFTISSMDALSAQLDPQKFIIIKVTFRPTSADTEAGEVIQPIIIGSDSFKLTAVALDKSGLAEISTITEDGTIEDPDIDGAEVGSIALPANSEKAYFECDAISCGETESWTNCRLCADPAGGKCHLFALSTTGGPVGEVDGSCKPKDPDSQPKMTVDLRGIETMISGKKVISIRNTGVENLTITGMVLEDVPNSKSPNQFSIRENAVYKAKSFEEINDAEPAEMPFVLPPYEKNYQEDSAYLVVTYQPTDLIGFDGSQAGIGSSVKDKAVLKVSTDRGSLQIEITGETAIREIPALELYFKTSTGLKRVEQKREFPFRDVTAETIDSAVPVFLKLADTASSAMRIVSIKIEGGESNFYEWLDTAESINSKNPPTGKGKRCSIPILDPSTGQMTNEIFDLNPVSLGAKGFDLKPGVYSTETMPLFGCLNFHRDVSSLSAEDAKKLLFTSYLVITAQELDANGNPAKNPDGSYRQTELRGKVVAAINPITGKKVLRITQTTAAILNPQFPGLSAIASKDERDLMGRAIETDYQIFTGAFILDPFDEETITDLAGTRTLTTPGDGITAVFRPIDTHPVEMEYEDPFLFDFSYLPYDDSRPAGSRGIFEGFPNVPPGTKSNGWRIFTGTLSYPGPLAPIKIEEYSECLIINPCSPEGLRKFTDAGVPPGEKGACAFFYASGGHWESPAFHKADEMEGGEYKRLCDAVGQNQNLLDINTGRYTLEGSMIFTDIGFRFFGPTYFHNPGGPLGPVPPLDVIFHVGFTTDTLKPPAAPDDLNVLPDEKIDLAHQAYKINLNDPTLVTPAICEKNTHNRLIGGRRYSTWKYLAPLLSKDEDGLIPAGCPEEDNDFTGGSAFLHGRRLNHETGIVTYVTMASFGSSDDLTFAFKDIMMFVALNGWICDPEGREEDFEGSHCYDTKFNERDALSQISIIK
jgi:hypothetical protein